MYFAIEAALSAACSVVVVHYYTEICSADLGRESHIAHRVGLELSRGLSRVEAGNPGFPRLVQVTSGGFSEPGKLEVGGASRDSTGLGALEEGLISS